MTISEERVESYISSLRRGLPEYLCEMASKAREEGVPIIRDPMIDLMRTLLALRRPMTILEIGCAIGFSALLMKEYAPKGCKITTIESYEPRIIKAKENFCRYDEEQQITLIEGDAVEKIKEMSTGFDMIFMDAAKAQYVTMYDDVKRLLVPGGMLLSDNVFQEGDIIESRYAVTRRDRTIHSRMREYLNMLSQDDDYTTTILAAADGVAISVRK